MPTSCAPSLPSPGRAEPESEAAPAEPAPEEESAPEEEPAAEAESPEERRRAVHEEGRAAVDDMQSENSVSASPRARAQFGS